MRQVRWAILGPGSIAGNFATGLAEVAGTRLAAVASRDVQRAVAFGARHGVAAADCHGGYAQLLARDDIDAVYVATVHVTHAQLTLDALAAGKHVVVEKPAAVNAATWRAMTDRARTANLFLLEACMHRFHPQLARVRELLASGVIGEVVHVDATFGYNLPEDPSSRLYDPATAGGGILDIGCYPVSFARFIAGCAQGVPFAEPLRVRGVGRRAGTGVDAEARAVLEFADGLLASCTTAVDRDLDSVAVVSGTLGELRLLAPWCPGKAAAPSDAEIVVTTAAGSETELISEPSMLYALEARAATAAIAAGELQTSEMSWLDTLGNLSVLDAWRDEIGYSPPAERMATHVPLVGVVSVVAPVARTELPYVRVPMSKLVMGCDNQQREADGFVIWDAWLEAGGNAFDTGWIYGGGRMERLLGEWLRANGLRDEVSLVVKGCHTPRCDPASLRLQLDESLERLGSDHAEIYMLHRDNLDYPVGEFVDVLDELAASGRIGAFGASNWTLPRLQEANGWAAAHGKRAMTVLSNNLSLATMREPMWPGCISAHGTDTLDYLREQGMAHLAWSSQARGYFLDEGIRARLPGDYERCFGGSDNARRRARAQQLADERGVSANNIALAWVLGQQFLSCALVGPRSPGELATSLPALQVELSADELAWLDLRRATR